MKLSSDTIWRLRHAGGYLALGLKREAEEALADVAEVEADALPVLAMRAAVYHELADWLRAAEASTRLCERAPDDAGHWIQRAYAVRRSRDIVEAKSILIEALVRHPNCATIRFNLACYDAQLGRLDEAREYLAAACRLDAQFAQLAKTDPDLEPLR